MNMDFEQNDNMPGPTEPPGPGPVENAGPGAVEPVLPPGPQPPTGAKPRKTRSGWKIFWGIVTGFSVLANIALFMILVGVIAFFAVGERDLFVEEVVEEGPHSKKIAIVNLGGIIDGRKAYEITRQLKAVRKDDRVKGLIIRVDSPGGTISGSDQIYNEIRKFRLRENKPVVAFMQGVAASGGYYTSVACEQIVAEPTVITGSIGVIMGYLVVEELFEEKLGIQMVTVKSGRKKDWPSMFQSPSEEQLRYLDEKLIRPAYHRFVEIVAEGRALLTAEQVKPLADGSIYTAQEALDNKLVDSVGYLDDAILLVKSLANIDRARVVEYRKPFSLYGFLGAEAGSIFKINKNSLYELSTPQVLYLWSIY